MSAAELVDQAADCWAPVPLPWRLVVTGELFVSGSGALWALVKVLAEAEHELGPIVRPTYIGGPS